MKWKRITIEKLSAKAIMAQIVVTEGMTIFYHVSTEYTCLYKPKTPHGLAKGTRGRGWRN